MSFDPSNRSLKIQNFIRILTPKVGVHLGVCGLIPSHCFAFSGMWMWFLDCILGTRTFPCLPFSREPKARVVACYFRFLLYNFPFHVLYRWAFSYIILRIFVDRWVLQHLLTNAARPHILQIKLIHFFVASEIITKLSLKYFFCLRW